MRCCCFLCRMDWGEKFTNIFGTSWQHNCSLYSFLVTLWIFMPRKPSSRSCCIFPICIPIWYKPWLSRIGRETPTLVRLNTHVTKRTVRVFIVVYPRVIIEPFRLKRPRSLRGISEWSFRKFEVFGLMWFIGNFWNLCKFSLLRESHFKKHTLDKTSLLLQRRVLGKLMQVNVEVSNSYTPKYATYYFGIFWCALIMRCTSYSFLSPN